MFDGRVPEPWWLRSAAPIVTQTNQIYVYMQIVRGRFREIYVYIALQASQYFTTSEAVFQGQHNEIGCKGKEALLQGSANIVSPQWAIWLKIVSLMPQFSFLTAHG